MDEIVWAGGWPAVSGISSSYFAIDYLAVSPDKVVSIDTLNDEDWYGVLINISEGHLYPMDPNERSYWIDGIDEDGKLTALINDYNSKYKACMDFCEKLPVDKINDSLRTDEYMELHNQAVSAKNAWKEYCENFYKATETRLLEELENETDYSTRLDLRRTIDFNQNASGKMNKAFIFVENNFDMRLRLLGLYNYGTVTGNSEGTNVYLAQIKDLKKIKERVHSFEVLQVYWAPNPYAED